MTTPREPAEPGEPGRDRPVEPMPATPALNEQQDRTPRVAGERPKPVRVAFALWLVVAAFLLLNAALLLLANTQTLEDAARTFYEQQGATVTDQEISEAARDTRIYGGGYNLIVGGLMAVLAFLMRGGRNWARTALCVLGGLVVALALVGFGATLLILLAEVVVMAVAVFMMFRPENKPYFRTGGVSATP